MASTDVEINGVKKPFKKHFLHALMNPYFDTFSTTHIVRRENDTFVCVGDFLHTSVEDIEHVLAGRYVYVPVYRTAQTRFSGDQRVRVGAIIVGSNDEKLAELFLEKYNLTKSK